MMQDNYLEQFAHKLQCEIIGKKNLIHSKSENFGTIKSVIAEVNKSDSNTVNFRVSGEYFAVSKERTLNFLYDELEISRKELIKAINKELPELPDAGTGFTVKLGEKVYEGEEHENN